MGTMPTPGPAPSNTRPRVPLAKKSWVGRLLRQFKLQLSHQPQCHQVVQARNRPQLLTVVPVAVVLVVVVGLL